MEVWKDIKNYEGLYQVSNLGRVKSLSRKKGKRLYKGVMLKPINRNGYLAIWLYKDGKKHIENIHRLVAQAFIPIESHKPVVNHIDGNKHNNRVDNLEWTTISYNTQHAYDKGLITLTPKMREVRKTNIKKATKACQLRVKCVETGVIYDSLKEASKKVGLKTSVSLCKACKEEWRTAGGYHWVYVN